MLGTLKNKLREIEREVLAWLESIRHSPRARYESRVRFYARYGHGLLGEGLGNSELAFMRWEERAVLRPPDANPPGSAWWSAVNLHFIYLCELAVKAHRWGIPRILLPRPSRLWLDYIDRADDVSWYRAHNSSIIDGYLKFPELAARETVTERVFLNMVLYRVLFAQAMVEGEDFAFGPLGELLANPRGPAVDLMTQLTDFYPDNYPLSPEDVRDIMGRAHNLEELAVEFLDDVIIHPELERLYRLGAGWNHQPDLIRLVRDGQPAYPHGRKLPLSKRNWLIQLLLAIRLWLATAVHRRPNSNKPKAPTDG